MAESYPIVYTYHIFSIHSSVHGCFGCFHVLAVVNSAAILGGVSSVWHCSASGQTWPVQRSPAGIPASALPPSPVLLPTGPHPPLSLVTLFYFFHVPQSFLGCCHTYSYHAPWGKALSEQGLVCFISRWNPSLWNSAWHSLDSWDIFWISEWGSERINEWSDWALSVKHNLRTRGWNVANRWGSCCAGREHHIMSSRHLSQIYWPQDDTEHSHCWRQHLTSAALTAC